MSTLNNISNVTVPSIGKLPLAQDPGTFTPSGFNRSPKPGRKPADGGTLKTATVATLALNINLKPGLNVDAINAVENEDIVITLEDGQVWMMMGASCQDPVPVGNGESQVTFTAPESEQIG